MWNKNKDNENSKRQTKHELKLPCSDPKERFVTQKFDQKHLGRNPQPGFDEKNGYYLSINE